eukprot:5463491-Prymnesium_polylepis.1
MLLARPSSAGATVAPPAARRRSQTAGHIAEQRCSKQPSGNAESASSASSSVLAGEACTCTAVSTAAELRGGTTTANVLVRPAIRHPAAAHVQGKPAGASRVRCLTTSSCSMSSVTADMPTRARSRHRSSLPLSERTAMSMMWRARCPGVRSSSRTPRPF